ncbi:HupE/UreJ family protein [Pseudovibrio sp. Tun.PSC04-5.I4]|uniref:HupE/UreJ family protein n=1 Tax=Pseudovibrio sp. Tun.PSC04-5.I4 TaxID=1798213 RepID=UPI0008828CD7|nr:HupE/UreJ family protein [Pseudovibrio sp. Tun.PSC04-5.I4]SDR47612.1 urease accessory protein [Pseudovibrio sp. Tun.PSC04-5.I4]
MRLKEITGVMSLIAALMVIAEPALAAGFSGAQAKADFLNGLWHPLGGLDHILTMVGVGIWAALVLTRKRLVWPLVFMLVMFMAFWARFIGVVIPYIEPGILISIIVIGLLIAFALKLPVVVGALIVGVFAVFHGAAHANEANAGSLLIYAAGFSVSTFALSLSGLGLGSLTEWSSGRLILRAFGAASALFGIYLLYMNY